MKRILNIAIIIVVTFTTPCFAKSDSTKKVQKASTAKTDIYKHLRTVHDILENESFQKHIWSLGIQFQQPGYIGLPSEIVENFRTWLLKKGWKAEPPFSNSPIEMELYAKYAKNIERLIYYLQNIDGGTALYLSPKDSESNLPICFAQKDNKSVFLLTRVASPTVLNTLRLSEKRRAAKIISSIILPSMKEFQQAFNNSDISYYGMIVIFGSKDFSKEGISSNLYAEIVCMVVSADRCKKYIEAEITADDLLDSADIYLDVGPFRDIKKIKINLD